ncbi:sialidase family protein [Membranihabitans marinus]|uniref:sialidase family protein n=1 Tax=Membranihabitans marinus TaxID=1227546 RepID=UPI001F1E4E40|nr:sialidase family protein [Membranihabitans marinus]
MNSINTYINCFFCLVFLSVFQTPVWGQVEDKGHSGLSKIEDIIIYEDDDFFSAFPSVVKKQDGEILVAFRRAPNRAIFGEGKNYHVDPNSYLVYVRSRDNGLSWTSEPELLYAHPYGGSQDPCMLLLKDGSMLCTSYGWAAVRDDGLPNLKQPVSQNIKGAIALGGYYLRSFDGGETWKGPYYPPSIPSEVRYTAKGDPFPSLNRGALTEGKDGRLFWVVATSYDKDNIARKMTSLLISEDKGMTWELASTVAVDDKIDFNETSIYETPKGDLVAFLRTANFDGQACIARSVDGGKSFQPWQPMGFKGYPLQALRLPDNRVLLVYGYRSKPYGIRARILNAECDDFATSKEFVIRDDGGSTDLGYPWAVMLDDNRVLVTYYYNIDNGTRHIAGSVLKLD